MAFFVASDGIADGNLLARILTEMQVHEANAFYGFQMAMGNIRVNTHALLIERYIRCPRESTFNAIRSVVKEKAEGAV